MIFCGRNILPIFPLFFFSGTFSHMLQQIDVIQHFYGANGIADIVSQYCSSQKGIEKYTQSKLFYPMPDCGRQSCGQVLYTRKQVQSIEFCKLHHTEFPELLEDFPPGLMRFLFDIYQESNALCHTFYGENNLAKNSFIAAGGQGMVCKCECGDCGVEPSVTAQKGLLPHKTSGVLSSQYLCSIKIIKELTKTQFFRNTRDDLAGIHEPKPIGPRLDQYRKIFVGPWLPV